MDHGLYSVEENKDVFACYTGRQRLGTHGDLAAASPVALHGCVAVSVTTVTLLMQKW